MRLIFAFFTAFALLLAPHGASAQDKTPIRFVLDWKYQGVHSWYFLAQKRGYFAKEGLDVKIDQGDGSAATVTHIMAGTYDAGFGDVNAIIQNASLHPGAAPVMVYMIYNTPPFAMATLADGPIKTVKDIAGHTVGAPAGSAALKLFPLVAKAAGVDMSTVKVLNMAPNLQEQMLTGHQVDGSLVFNVTSYINFIGMHLDPDKDIRWFLYKDYGVDLYSNGVMVSQDLIKKHPKAVAGLVRAINHGLEDAVKDPDAAIDALAEQEPLLNKTLEKRRLLYALRTLVLTPEEARIGVGAIDDARMKKAIGQAAAAFSLTSAPKVSDVFNAAFLPPKSMRLPKLAN